MAAPITGKTVVVVGGSRGIGAEFVKQFALKGNRVIAGCRQPAQAKELAGIENVELATVDVASPQSIQAFAASVQQLTPHADVVLNNAGIMGRRAGFEDVNSDDMLSLFTTNAIGPLLVVQALHRVGVLGGSKPTLVANITSKMGSIDDNGSGRAYAYRASKAALNIINKSLSIDLMLLNRFRFPQALNIINKSLSIDLAGDGCTVTLLHPGWVQTDMTGGSGLITKETSVSGMIGVLESGVELQGTWHDYAGKPIAW